MTARREFHEPSERELRIERGASDGMGDVPVLPYPTKLRDVTEDTGLSYLAEGFLIRQEINAIVGDGGSMKSTTLYAVTAALACAQPIFGALHADHGAVLYLSGEDSKPVIKNRLLAIAKGHDWDAERLLDRVYILTEQDDGVNLDDPLWQARLIEITGDLEAVAVMVDAVIDLSGPKVEENSNTDAKRITRYSRRLIAKTGTTVNLAMHVTKPSEGKTERQHRVRGAGVWKNATRLSWWSELAAGGVELEDIKRNRSVARGIMRLKVEIESEPENDLVWQRARITLDQAGPVMNTDVIRLLRYLDSLDGPRSGRDLDGAHESYRVSSRDRATGARLAARDHQWISFVDGPHNSQLWSLTDAGRARLMLGAE